jgi:phospholipase C
VGIAGTIASEANSKINDALSRNAAMGQFGKAIRPWLLGGAFEIRAAGSRFGEIWVDFVEPLPVAPPPVARSPVQPGNLAKIDHIVVLMMENRSFDHMLGYLSLPGGRPSGKAVNGLRGGELNRFRGQDFPSHLLDKTFIEFSPCHGFICTQHQMSDNMGGFVASFAEHDEALGADISVVMGHYDGKLLPVYDQLAAQFAICDRWHAAHPGPTWPNRFITVSGRLNKDAFDQFEFDNPNLGRFAPSLVDTIFDVLSANRVSWRYYENGYSFIRLFERHTFDVKNVLGFSSFLRDAAAGALPSVSFIDPDFVEFPPGADDQAPSDPIDGQRFIGTVVNALMASPNWPKTLLIVTYDELGGFYDQVNPPTTPVKFEGDLDRYGVRLTTFLVSPFVEPGEVVTQLLDHASIQATIQRRFLGPQAPDLGPRVAHAADVGSALTRATPRTGLAPLTLPAESPNRRRARPSAQPFPSSDSQEFNDLLFLARMFTGIGPK